MYKKYSKGWFNDQINYIANRGIVNLNMTVCFKVVKGNLLCLYTSGINRNRDILYICYLVVWALLLLVWQWSHAGWALDKIKSIYLLQTQWATGGSKLVPLVDSLFKNKENRLQHIRVFFFNLLIYLTGINWAIAKKKSTCPLCSPCHCWTTKCHACSYRNREPEELVPDAEHRGWAEAVQ